MKFLFDIGNSIPDYGNLKTIDCLMVVFLFKTSEFRLAQNDSIKKGN